MSALPDKVEQDFATALTGERHCWWTAGDVAAHGRTDGERLANPLES